MDFFFFLRLPRPAVLKQREIGRGYIEVPNSCNTLLKNNRELQSFDNCCDVITDRKTNCRIYMEFLKYKESRMPRSAGPA